jgi:hypothetical protein
LGRAALLLAREAAGKGDRAAARIARRLLDGVDEARLPDVMTA